MLLLYQLLHLPLLLLSTSPGISHTPASRDSPWQHPSPLVNHSPEDIALARRNNITTQMAEKGSPILVKKMSSDPGEMFFLDYWLFQENDSRHTFQSDNTTASVHLDQPFPRHVEPTGHASRPLERYLRLPIPATNLFIKRDFVCPSGTNACSSINRPNVCCPTSATCQIVPNSGLGDVGCCAAGSTCAGSLSQCPSGYNSCPSSSGGGCCLPGYACFQQGCVQTSTTVVFVSPSTSSTTPPPPPSTVTDTRTIIITSLAPSSVSQPPPSPTTVTRTEIITSIISATSAASATLSSASSSVSNCASGLRSCPASLGGLCCPTELACASNSCATLTSTDSLIPPVRGTSSSASAASTDIPSGCPIGFYACSAYLPGRCCQIGRDCQPTSCPAGSGITVVNSGSITVVAPSGASLSRNLPSGTCAMGWATCEANLGGGCCPSGYACGTAACTATITGLSGTQAKNAPSGSGRVADGTRLRLTYHVAMVAISLLMMT